MTKKHKWGGNKFLKWKVSHCSRDLDDRFFVENWEDVTCKTCLIHKESD